SVKKSWPSTPGGRRRTRADEGAEAAGAGVRRPRAPLGWRAAVTDLFAPVCSIATTRRRRYLWAAWWSGPPTRQPFRKPDAYGGGARTVDDARREAERVAGRPLVLAPPLWA